MTVRVDGPYGNLNMNYRQNSVVVFVVGGIGITPALSFLKDLYLSQKPKQQVEKAYLIWTIPTKEQYQWFSKDIEEFQAATIKVDLTNFLIC